ncbi:hypothetical protein AF331_12560 [Rossellomorea marisflavi]|uniref:Restriction endonuclease n=1 Tax=Rossellomorea marisflavi TaxID=189381 RepID=A0A0M0G4X2_9BACI|nr:type II restriction endonuclease [Rossellomorea marisflavi]KON84838.1 hypothetical protein AF331_12560 [Rossellomorea marisflavi]
MSQNNSGKLSSLLEAAKHIGRFYCKFVTANDVGLTNAHQEGIHISKSAWGIFFQEAGTKGENKHRIVKIDIEGLYPFDSRVSYYGKGTRNEYRITRFWTNSPFDKARQLGNLIIFLPMGGDNFKVYILDTDDEIELFTQTFSLNLVNNNAVYNHGIIEELNMSKKLEEEIEKTVLLYNDFPSTVNMATISRAIHYKVYKNTKKNSDQLLLEWVKTEFATFRTLEKKLYQEYLTKPFLEVEPLITVANSILNRRKSRAGQSLEHHVDFLLNSFQLPFAHPGKSEGNKKPDFLLPSNNAYSDSNYPTSSLIFLGAKTTCKDRWRQILNEANRISEKHLLTLQQGISANQLDEMAEEKVTLVVPEPYHKMYPAEYRDRLWTVEKFIEFAKGKYLTKEM